MRHYWNRTWLSRSAFRIAPHLDAFPIREAPPLLRCHASNIPHSRPRLPLCRRLTSPLRSSRTCTLSPRSDSRSYYTAQQNRPRITDCPGSPRSRCTCISEGAVVPVFIQAVDRRGTKSRNHVPRQRTNGLRMRPTDGMAQSAIAAGTERCAAMNWPQIGYALTCVVLPMAWGLLVVRISNAIERRIRAHERPGDNQEIPPIDYHI